MSKNSKSTKVCQQTNVTLLTNQGEKPLTKVVSVVNDVVTIETHAKLYEGTYQKLSASTPSALKQIIDNLQGHQALAYGIPHAKAVSGRITTIAQKKEDKEPSTIARCKEDIAFAKGSGWLMLDVDYNEDPSAPPTDWDSLFEALDTIIPDIRDEVPMLTGHSASSYINNPDGSTNRGEQGKRIYILVKDARDIPRVGKAIHQRLMLGGGFQGVITKCGDVLAYSQVDASVFQGCRLDFCAGALCQAGTSQIRPESVCHNEDKAPFDTKKIKSITAKAEKDIQLKVLTFKTDQSDAINKVRELWKDNRMPYKPVGMVDEVYRRQLDAALDTNHLDRHFVVPMPDGQMVTVGDIVNDKEKWNNELTLDPFEPEYCGGKIVGKIIFKGNDVVIHSFAHGAHVYKLEGVRASIVVDLVHPDEAIREIATEASMREILFAQGTQMVRVNGESIDPLTTTRAMTMTSQVATLFKQTAKGLKSFGCPKGFAELFDYSLGSIRQLKGFATLPTMRADGSILTRKGYDEGTNLIYTGPEVEVPVLDTKEKLEKALTLIWSPFRLFPMISDESRGSLMAAILTAATRKMFPTAPAFLTTAPDAGTGKTLMQSALSWLATGRKVGTTSLSYKNDEMTKELLAAFVELPQTLIFDNMNKNINNSFLAQILTSPEIDRRKLGVSENAKSVPTQVFIMCNGINIGPEGEMQRRFCNITINAEVDNPGRRVFDFDPVDLVKENTVEMRLAALAIVRAFKKSKWKPSKDIGGVGSFKEWDETIRHCVLWLNTWSDLKLGDPKPEDSEADMLEAKEEMAIQGVEALIDTYGINGKVFSAGDAAKEVVSASNGDATLLDEWREDLQSGNNARLATQIGYWLRTMVGQRGYANCTVERVPKSPNSKKSQKYYLKGGVDGGSSESVENKE